MKKSYRLEELECAHCAAKMETAIAKLHGVEKVTISFMTQKMTLETWDERHEAIVEEAQKIIRRIEPDCRIIR